MNRGHFALLFLIVLAALPLERPSAIESYNITHCGNPILLAGEVDEKMLKQVFDEVVPCLIDQGPGATVYVTSTGGDPGYAQAIYDLVTMVGNRNKLTTVALGNVASAGVTVFLAGGHREISCRGSLFIHPLRTNLGEDKKTYTKQEAWELFELTDGLEGISNDIAQTLSKLPMTEILQLKFGKLLDAQAAVEQGFAEKVRECK